MVSVGTLLSVGVVGAVVAAGVAVYANRGGIGQALTRGIQGTLTDPLGDFVGGLFRSAAGSGNGSAGDTEAQRQAALEELERQNQALRDAAQQSYEQQYGQEVKTPDQVLDLFEKYFGPAPGQPAPPLPPTFPGEEHRGANPLAPKNEPLFAPSPAGYYYVDYAGRKYDTQYYFGAGAADAARKSYTGEGAFKGLHFLGQSKLTEQGFSLFGSSKNLYL